MEWQMLIYLNRDRKGFGLIKLRFQEDLREVARRHSKDMAKKDYFEHVNLKGQSPSDRLKTARITDVVSGENLAKIGGYPEPVIEAEEGLMRSPGHRANILNKTYNCVGIGVIKSRDGVYYFTQNFAKRILRFTKKIRKHASIDKGLRLKGFSVEPIDEIFYEVKFPGTSKAINKGGHLVKDRHFDFRVKFKDVGLHEVRVFVAPSSNTKKKSGMRRMHLANQFEISVKRWWFWR
jgi:hypothetical protein